MSRFSGVIFHMFFAWNIHTVFLPISVSTYFGSISPYVVNVFYWILLLVLFLLFLMQYFCSFIDVSMLSATLAIYFFHIILTHNLRMSSLECKALHIVTILLSSGSFVWVLCLFILSTLLSILQEGQVWCLVLWWYFYCCWGLEREEMNNTKRCKVYSNMYLRKYRRLRLPVTD